MSDLRLICTVMVPSDHAFPPDDAHPFWLALDEMADAVAASARARGLDPDALEIMSESEDGSLLVQSSDTPRSVARLWVYLPRDATVQAVLLPTLLTYLAEAREALPDADWTVTLGDEPLIWDGARFQLPG